MRVFRQLGIALIFLMAVLQAQTATVMGTVTHKNNKPAVNVLVLIAGKSRYTDGGGRYRIDGVPQGRQKMQITSGKTVLLNIEIEVSGASAVVNQTVP